MPTKTTIIIITRTNKTAAQSPHKIKEQTISKKYSRGHSSQLRARHQPGFKLAPQKKRPIPKTPTRTSSIAASRATLQQTRQENRTRKCPKPPSRRHVDVQTERLVDPQRTLCAHSEQRRLPVGRAPSSGRLVNCAEYRHRATGGRTTYQRAAI